MALQFAAHAASKIDLPVPNGGLLAKNSSIYISTGPLSNGHLAYDITCTLTAVSSNVVVEAGASAQGGQFRIKDIEINNKKVGGFAGKAKLKKGLNTVKYIDYTTYQFGTTLNTVDLRNLPNFSRDNAAMITGCTAVRA